MNRIVYLLTLFFFMLAVSTGVCMVLSEFNRMVRPAAPVRVFNLETAGNQVYHVEFLGVDANMRLPVNLTRVEDFMEKGKAALKGVKYPEVAGIKEVFAGWWLALQQAGGGLVSDILARTPAAAESIKNICKPGRTER